MIKVIGNEGCSRCTMVKNLLINKKIEFTYSLLNELPKEEQDEYLKQANEKGLLNMPLIIKNNELVDLKEVM